MVPILVASNIGYAGRTFISLGLALKLMDMGYKVGMMKPFGTVPVKAARTSTMPMLRSSRKRSASTSR